MGWPSSILSQDEAHCAALGIGSAVATETSSLGPWSAVAFCKSLCATSLARVLSLAGVLPSPRKLLYNESL
jgi:hypothetical protein